MADRVLVWCYEDVLRCNKERVGPTYYMDADYEPVAVRIYATQAPNLDDAEFDIKIDGASIFSNRTATPIPRPGDQDLIVLTTTAILPKGENYEVDAEDFKRDLVIGEGSWVYCVPVNSAGGKNFTISLELDEV